jgi:hypothetical protein
MKGDAASAGSEINTFLDDSSANAAGPAKKAKRLGGGFGGFEGW